VAKGAASILDVAGDATLLARVSSREPLTRSSRCGSASSSGSATRRRHMPFVAARSQLRIPLDGVSRIAKEVEEEI
jgi:hypothetical protein